MTDTSTSTMIAITDLTFRYGARGVLVFDGACWQVVFSTLAYQLGGLG